MKRLVFIAVSLAFVGAACINPQAAPPVDPEAADCINGVMHAQARLQGKAVASVHCEWSATMPASGLFVGEAVVFYGPIVRDQPVEHYARTAAHELGHAWDIFMLHDGHRIRFRDIMGLSSWDREKYADVFMMLAYGDNGPGFYGTPYPTPKQRAMLCGEQIVPC